MRNKRRGVLIIVEDIPVPFDRRVWHEATALRDDGYEVKVICRTGKGYESRHEVLDGIEIYRHPMPIDPHRPLGYFLEYAIALFWQTVLAWKVYFTRGFQVIHACSPPDLIFLVAAPFVLLGKKFVFDHHDLSPEFYEAKFGQRNLTFQILLGLERMSFALATVSIATNQSYRAVAIERGRMAPNRVFVVRNGPDPERMRVLAPVPALKCGRRYLVGYVGTMGSQDGVEYLIGAAQHIITDMGRADVHFGIVGGGPELSRLQSLVKELGIADYVTFTGRVPDLDMLQMLNTADVCVAADIYSEANDKSTMNKIMEYMALGKPVVQFDLSEGRVSAEDASLYALKDDKVDLARQVLALLDNPERRQEMGRSGRERVEKVLQWKHQIPSLLAAYGSLLNGDGHRLPDA